MEYVDRARLFQFFNMYCTFMAFMFFLKVAFWQSFLVLLKCFANRQAQRHEACESFRGIIKPVCKILFLVMMYVGLFVRLRMPLSF